MSFWDNVKKFAQPYADEEFDEYDTAEDGFEDADVAPRSRKSAVESVTESAPADLTGMVTVVTHNANVYMPLAELVVLMEEMGKERGLSIRLQREDIFEAMHRI